MAAAYICMRDLSFFTNINHGFIFATLTIIPITVNLFARNKRNPIAIFESPQQFYLFSLAILLAFVFNILLS